MKSGLVSEVGNDGGLHGYVAVLRNVSVSVSDTSDLRDVDGLRFLHGLLGNNLRLLDNDDGFLALGDTTDVLGAAIRLQGSGAVSTERLSHASSLGAFGRLNGLGFEVLANQLSTSATATARLMLSWRRHNIFTSSLWRDLNATAQFFARFVLLAENLVSVSHGPSSSRASAATRDLRSTANKGNRFQYFLFNSKGLTTRVL